MSLDLQFHSTYSDGADTVQALVAMAAENNLELACLTDHDNIHGVAEFLKLAAAANIKAIAGVEISAYFHDKVVHILGYNIRLDNAELNEYLDNLLAQRKAGFLARIPAINAALTEKHGAGAKLIDPADAVASMGEYWGKPVFADYMVKRGITKTKAEAIDYLLNMGIIYKIDAAKAIEIIHGAGGKAVMSHPMAEHTSVKEIAPNIDEQERLLYELKEMGLDGLEAFQCAHGPGGNQLALKFAEKYDFGITAGTDWHGAVAGEPGADGQPTTPGIDRQILRAIANYPRHLGDVDVPEEYVEKIKEFLLG